MTESLSSKYAPYWKDGKVILEMLPKEQNLVTRRAQVSLDTHIHTCTTATKRNQTSRSSGLQWWGGGLETNELLRRIHTD